eukprot:s1635_g5.t1
MGLRRGIRSRLLGKLGPQHLPELSGSGRLASLALMALPKEWTAGERHTCKGIGWVQFDPSVRQKQLAHPLHGSADALGFTPPKVRCFGSSSRSRASPDNGPGEGSEQPEDGWSQVETTTWALVCGGQLRMMTPRPASSDKENDSPDPSLPTLWQCSGVSFRIERVPADDVVHQPQASSQEQERQLPAANLQEA